MPPRSKVKKIEKNKVKKAPQKEADKFWDKYISKQPGELHSVLPRDAFAELKASHEIEGPTYAQVAHKLYVQAELACHAAVKQISDECRRTNTRYRDPYFDLEFDLKKRRRKCLEGLRRGLEEYKIGSAKPLPEIFENPEFYIEGGPKATSIRQGHVGDCWFLSAVSAISHVEGLVHRVCVARDEKVGVYGFVFYRDGEWTYTIIDDQLYLTVPDYQESSSDRKFMRRVYESAEAAEEHRKRHQTGSRALYFAQCMNENETWLPLLEKAYAKAHGDFNAIAGGYQSEAIEDLTGGVGNEIHISDILDRNKFWKEELMNVNNDFLFGCVTGTFDDWRDEEEPMIARQGITRMHSYTILEAKEVEGKRLMKIRNPWGRGEWSGAWGDGSENWTPEWMERLNHKFGDDGLFLMTYEDFLRTFTLIERNRLLFAPEWQTVQQWTTITVPWMGDYSGTKFRFTATKRGPVVIVLSQLDERYYSGLESRYRFNLHFRLEKQGAKGYIARSYKNYFTDRSTSVDLELEAGTYTVLMKISATPRPKWPAAADVIRTFARTNAEKLAQVGLRYDLAHAKGRAEDPETEKKLKWEAKKAVLRKEQRDEKKAEKYKHWLKRVRKFERYKRYKEKKKAKRSKKRAEKDKTLVADPQTQLDFTTNVEGLETEGDHPGEGDNEDNNQDKSKSKSRHKGKGKTKEERGDKEKGDRERIDRDRGASRGDGPVYLYEFNKWVQQGPDWVESGTAVSSGPALRDKDDAVSISSFDSSIDSVLDLESIPDERSDDEELKKGDKVKGAFEEDPNAAFENDPWDAVCVVGLRVYSKDSGITIEVIRPTDKDDEKEQPLDVDDPNKAISESNGNGNERKIEEKSDSKDEKRGPREGAGKKLKGHGKHKDKD